MSKLKLIDVADLIMGQSPPSSTYNEMGNGLPFLQGKAEFGRISPNPIKYCSSPNKRAPSNSILMSVRAPVGDVNMADQEYAIGRGLASIVPKKYDLWYLYFYLSSQKARLDALASGTTFKSINKTVLSTFPIPECYPENQRAIGIVLCAIQNAKETREIELALERERKAALMAYLFTHGTRGEALKQTQIGEMPKSWNVKSVSQIYEYTKKPRGIKIKDDQIIPFIPMDLITENEPFIDAYNEIAYSDMSSGAYFEKGDLLISKITPCFENGKQGVVENIANNFGYATTEIIAIKDIESVSNKHFLSYYLRHAPIRHSLTEKMVGSTGRKRLSKDSLSNTLMPCPSYEEQGEIANALLAHDKYTKALHNEVVFLNELFHSMLDELMSGKLSVEPLLEAKKIVKKKVAA